MTTDPTTTEALLVFRERAQHLIELIADQPDNDEWGEILIQEATYLVEEGAAAYVKYVQKLDAAAVRADLDRHLDTILGRNTP